MVMLAEHYDFVIGGDPDRDTIDLAVLDTGAGRVLAHVSDAADGPPQILVDALAGPLDSLPERLIQALFTAWDNAERRASCPPWSRQWYASRMSPGCFGR